MFVDATGGNFRLLSISPAIDSGTSSGAPETDIDLNNRLVGSNVDIGAYEFQLGGETSPVPTGSNYLLLKP